jgi:gluconolactonase
MQQALGKWLFRSTALVLAAAGGCSSNGRTAASNDGVMDASSGSSDGGSSGGSSGASSGASSAGSGAAPEAAAPIPTGPDGGPAYPVPKLSDFGTPVVVSSQFYFTEGPVWDPQKGVLYFTDINAHQGAAVGGAIYRFTPPNTFDVLLQPDGNADGLGLDPQGNIIAAGFVARSVWRLSNGATQVLSPCASPASASCFTGNELNTPDDVTSRSDGILYVTDPTFASGAQGFPSQTLPLANAQGVYRLTTDGVLHIEDSSASGPNGVNLSSDEQTLYVSYTNDGTVAKFAVAADGSLSGKAMFASGLSVPDSMCVDAAGNLYVGTTSGLAVFTPDGTSVGTVNVGGQVVTNCAFGGPDQRTLYVTTRAFSTLLGNPTANDSALYAIAATPVPGIPGRN